MKDKTAIIVGCNGQDGQLLKKKLINLKYKIIGITKNNIDIRQPNKVNKLVAEKKPDQIYYLAAHHHSSEEIINNNVEIIDNSNQINFISLNNFLHAIHKYSPSTKFFYASSCHVFGSSNKPQNEDTKYQPEGIYGVTKIAGMMSCKHFREVKRIFVSVGILYNHDSFLRKKVFVGKKIISSAIEISKKGHGQLTLGNLDHKIDWGAAHDYVDAMHLILNLSKPNDYVISTGKLHSIREFAKIAFDYFKLDYRKFIIENPKILSRTNKMRIGDSTRLKKDTGWKPLIIFKDIHK